MVITDSTPAAAAIQRKSLLFGIRFLNTHDAKYQSERRKRKVPRPTITSHARCTTSTSALVGRSSSGNASRPWMTVLVPSVGSDRIEARPGIGMPPSTSPSSFR